MPHNPQNAGQSAGRPDLFVCHTAYQVFISCIRAMRAGQKPDIVLASGVLPGAGALAERLAAGPGSKTYGILSVLLQAWYEVEYLFTVSEKVFDPPPKVKSAVIRMVRNDRKSLGCDEKLFKTVVKTSFNQRRKTLRNSMKPLLGKDCPDYSLPIFDKRPEQLSVEQFVELTLITERNLKDL